MKQVFVQGRRLSAEGLLTVEGIRASTVVEGSMKREGLLQFLENHVVHNCTHSHLSNQKYAASALFSIPWPTECPCNG